MKRSEMFIQLVQLLVLAEAYNLGYKEKAEEVLGLIEKNGMLPPDVDRMIEGHLCSENKWESEDKPSYNEMREMMSKMDEEGFAFDNPNDQNELAMPKNSVNNLLEEITAEELLEQGICPCGSETSCGCNITGCALAGYNGEFDET